MQERGKARSLSGFPRQLRFSLLRSREIKTRKKRDHGESPAALFTRRNKFSALPKSHTFDFEEEAMHKNTLRRSFRSSRISWISGLPI